jgi:hypothetical protein
MSATYEDVSHWNSIQRAIELLEEHGYKVIKPCASDDRKARVVARATHGARQSGSDRRRRQR